MKKTYTIEDLSGYAESIREDAAREHSEDFTENLDDFISMGQVLNIIEEYAIGVDEFGNYIITEDIHFQCAEEINKWIYYAGVSKLCASNHIECAWDSELNEMIFWHPVYNKHISDTQ